MNFFLFETSNAIECDTTKRAKNSFGIKHNEKARLHKHGFDIGHLVDEKPLWRHMVFAGFGNDQAFCLEEEQKWIESWQ